MKCLTYILFFHVSLKSCSNMFMKTRFRFQIRCLIFRLAILVNYFPKINAENLQKPSKLSEIKMLFWGGGEVRYLKSPTNLKQTIQSRKLTVFCEQWRLYQGLLLANITENCIYPSTLNNEQEKMLRHFAPILMSDPTYNTDHDLYGAILFHVYTIPI